MIKAINTQLFKLNNNICPNCKSCYVISKITGLYTANWVCLNCGKTWEINDSIESKESKENI